MRVLIAIGCNDYQHANRLGSAEEDAKRIFSALAEPQTGWYDHYQSRLLLSPTLDDVRIALREILFSGAQLHTFTFFFAGHGGVARGSFYLWLRDTVGTAQAATAFALGDLFRHLNEASPRQTNIIIDACESGGLIEDLGVLLKPELLGDAGTPAITLVATSARNQEAEELDTGGLGTSALLDCIEGRHFVNSAHPSLDLVDIGRKISLMLESEEQSPVVWGLNLYGPPGFCRNPRYDRDGMAPLRDMVQEWPAEADAVIERNHDKLWAVYTSIAGNWVEGEFFALVRLLIQNSELAPAQASSVAERLANTFLQRASQASDPFRGPLIVSSLAASLLPYMASSEAEAGAARLLSVASVELNQVLKDLVADMSAERYALLAGTGGGLSDLYFLPQRVAKILGWAAAAPLLCQTDSDRAQAENQFSAVLTLLLENYADSIVALNDAQAPAWCISLAQAAALGLHDEGERLAGLLFYTLCRHEGHLARWDLAPEDALEFVLARSKNDFSTCFGLVERPIETLTVLLRASRLYGLGHVFDESLWRLDGMSFSAFIPTSLLDFNDDLMRSGRNLVWSVGQSVCRVEEFASTWPSQIPLPQSDIIKALAVVSSLVLPDRQPWFLLEVLPTTQRISAQPVLAAS